MQGLGGAVVSVVALSLTMIMFTEPAERAKAMGIFGFVLAGGGTAGVLLGGVLTDALSWNWIFLVNIPVGVAVVALCFVLLPNDRRMAAAGRLDVMGAVTVMASLMLAVYAIVNGNETGWASGETIGLLAAAAVLLALFVGIEARVSSPLIPLGLFRLRNVSTANAVAVLMAGATFGWFFLSALYLQLVLGYSPLEVGLAFLPATLVLGSRLDPGLRQARDALRHQADAHRRALAVRPSASSSSRARPSTGTRSRRPPRHARHGASAAASPSTRCFWLRWAMSPRPRPGSPRGSSIPRS